MLIQSAEDLVADTVLYCTPVNKNKKTSSEYFVTQR